jgi:beta-galactosidase
LQGCENLFLNIDYAGDVGRLYSGTELLDDNFYNGTTWEVGAKDSGQLLDKEVRLEILLLRKDAPIYLPTAAWPDFGRKPQTVKLNSVTAVPEYELERGESR